MYVHRTKVPLLHLSDLDNHSLKVSLKLFFKLKVYYMEERSLKYFFLFVSVPASIWSREFMSRDDDRSSMKLLNRGQDWRGGGWSFLLFNWNMEMFRCITCSNCGIHFTQGLVVFHDSQHNILSKDILFCIRCRISVYLYNVRELSFLTCQEVGACLLTQNLTSKLREYCERLLF